MCAINCWGQARLKGNKKWDQKKQANSSHYMHIVHVPQAQELLGHYTVRVSKKETQFQLIFQNLSKKASLKSTCDS